MASQLNLGVRLGRATAPGGALSDALLTVHFFVTSSALWFLCAGPVLGFVAVVGRLDSHPVIWVTAALTVPVWPAWYAVLTLLTSFAQRRGFPGRTFASFWSNWWQFFRYQPWLVAGPTVLTAVFVYNFVLFGSSDGALLLVCAGVALAFVVITAANVELIARPSRTRSAIARGGLAVARRPWVGMAWVFAATVYPLLVFLPIVGPVLLLPAPAVVALAAVVVSGARRPLIGRSAHSTSAQGVAVDEPHAVSHSRAAAQEG